MKKIIIGFGELLWDKHKTYELIGGAPGNFAYHTTQCGLDGYVVSAVGKDASGDRLLEEAKRHGLQCIVAQVEKPTSVVDINEDDINNPQYTIRTDVAWDYIPVTKELESWAQKADAVCFGTLAQRSIRTRETLQTFLSLMRSDALKIFDVNLRQQFYNREMIEESLGKSDILKLNEDEGCDGILVQPFFLKRGDYPADILVYAVDLRRIDGHTQRLSGFLLVGQAFPIGVLRSGDFEGRVQDSRFLLALEAGCAYGVISGIVASSVFLYVLGLCLQGIVRSNERHIEEEGFLPVLRPADEFSGHLSEAVGGVPAGLRRDLLAVAVDQTVLPLREQGGVEIYPAPVRNMEGLFEPPVLRPVRLGVADVPLAGDVGAVA